jgi:hypothetical protein
MPEITETAQTTNTAEPVVNTAVDTKAVGQETEKSILDGAVDEQKIAEDKRILEAKDEDLSDADKSKKADLLKAKASADSKVAKTVPEKYEVKVPDGYSKDMSLLTTLTPILKEIGVTQEQAQKLADAYLPFFKAKAEEGQKMVEKAQDDNYKAFVESEKKNTLEKLGAKANETLSFVAKFRDTHLSPKTIELLNASGIANNFEFISDLAKFGKMISEDNLVDGRRITNAQKSDGEVLYGSSKE